MKKMQQGFTLIELMIVVAIIGILAAIALPQYNAYRIRSAENACLGEAAAYAKAATAAIVMNDPVAFPIPAPANRACTGMVAAVDINSTAPAITPAAPGLRTTNCTYANASCFLNP